MLSLGLRDQHLPKVTCITDVAHCVFVFVLKLNESLSIKWTRLKSNHSNSILKLKTVFDLKRMVPKKSWVLISICSSGSTRQQQLHSHK